MGAMPASVPTSEEVTAYLAAHKLEPVIEDAVNDAVLKQVKVRQADCHAAWRTNMHASTPSVGHDLSLAMLPQNPFRHIAEVLLKKSEEVGEAKTVARVSIGETASTKKTAFSSGRPHMMYSLPQSAACFCSTDSHEFELPFVCSQRPLSWPTINRNVLLPRAQKIRCSIGASMHLAHVHRAYLKRVCFLLLSLLPLPACMLAGYKLTLGSHRVR